MRSGKYICLWCLVWFYRNSNNTVVMATVVAISIWIITVNFGWFLLVCFFSTFTKSYMYFEAISMWEHIAHKYTAIPFNNNKTFEQIEFYAVHGQHTAIDSSTSTTIITRRNAEKKPKELKHSGDHNSQLPCIKRIKTTNTARIFASSGRQCLECLELVPSLNVLSYRIRNVQSQKLTNCYGWVNGEMEEKNLVVKPHHTRKDNKR